MSDSIVLERLVRAGRVEDVAANRWTTVLLHKTYNSVPVVIATPSTDANGNNYPIPLIRNITTTSFEISLCVDNGSPSCAT